MATNYTSYKGNDDFRGWLSSQADKSWMLGYVGNDGSVNRSRASNDVKYAPNRVYGYGSADNFASSVASLYNDWRVGNAGQKQDNFNSQMLALAAANRTPVPRHINFDITGSWNKAREMATQAKSPVYQQMMNNFINDQQRKISEKKADVTMGKETLQTTLDRFLQDSGINRTRTAEDTATNIGEIQNVRAFDARTEGLSFDEANRALNEGLGASGMAESGLGQQRVGDAQDQRRIVSNEEVRRSNNQVEAQNTLMTRTFADLDIGETRKKEDIGGQKAKLDIDLERFIADQDAAKRDKEIEINLEKEAAIAGATQSYQGQLVDQWLNTLRGQGYTAQEIANAASIYK